MKSSQHFRIMGQQSILLDRICHGDMGDSNGFPNARQLRDIKDKDKTMLSDIPVSIASFGIIGINSGKRKIR